MSNWLRPSTVPIHCDQAALASNASRPAYSVRHLLEQHSMCQICLNLLTWSKTSEGIRLRQASHHTHMVPALLPLPACSVPIWQPEGLQMHSMLFDRVHSEM